MYRHDAQQRTVPPYRIYHRMSQTRVYHVWQRMVQRCLNPKSDAYERYGGRGISVCDRWRSFCKFYEDMGDPPAGHSLDRINNDGNYEPSNCRWATSVQQQRNRRNNRALTYAGQTMLLTDWSKSLGVSHAAIWARLKRGWSVEDALGTPFKRQVGHA